jgi:hypothetical protein
MLCCISQDVSQSSSGESGYGGINCESATYASQVCAGVAQTLPCLPLPHQLSCRAVQQVDARRVRIRSHPRDEVAPTDRLACLRGGERVWWTAQPSVSTASFPRVERCAQ